MPTNSKLTHLAIASLNLPTKVPALITYAQGIVKGMTGNASFPSPTPTLAAVTQTIANLQAAETAALARTKGAVATRNEARTALVQLLQQLKGQVQGAADAAPDNAPSIIQSAGLAVRKTPVRAPRVFGAKPGAVSGTVTLVTAAALGRRRWAWSSAWVGARPSAPS